MDYEKGTKPKSQNPWHKKGILFLLFLFVGGLIVLVAMGIAQNRPLRENIKYGIVLDAGSSHTSLFVYKWPAEKQNDTGIVQQHHMCKVKGKGISSYFSEVEKAGLSLTICMDEAKSKIPKDRHKETPVYLGATAGMRLLRLESPTASDAVLNAVKKFLQTYPFSFSGARIITGQEEGAYGWITINYLLENFKQDSSFFSWGQSKAKETWGALDLGGASTQITFATEKTIEEAENSKYFRLYGRDYHVYTQSFLCYGKDQALKIMRAKETEAVRTTELQDPCFNQGYTYDLLTENLYGSPCTKNIYTSQPTHSVKVQGTGNAQLCRDNIKKIFSFSHCAYSSCSFNGIYQPELQGEFGAFSAYYFVMNFLNVTNIQDPLTPALIQDTVEKFCKKPWETVKMEFPSIKEKYLSEYCFSGTYILSLLQDGYKFNTENWKNLKFLGKIGDSDAGWTLGYMLNLTNMIPAELPPSRPLSHGGYVALVVIFVLFLIIVLVIGYVCFRRNANKPTETV
ncbi:ectonucleoside triphosphate diphosphohydrolase 1 isoform X1 [Latimeria chalumnae]|uniref:ectonucleoside triphosphate diphosphohydrolase 1 isoform X1 n=1 Tax=Latimeria chalumnae TaxID=7897 RepID=UPI00313CF830